MAKTVLAGLVHDSPVSEVDALKGDSTLKRKVK